MEFNTRAAHSHICVRMKIKDIKVEQSRQICRLVAKHGNMRKNFKAFVANAWISGLVHDYQAPRNKNFIDWQHIVLDHISDFEAFGIESTVIQDLIANDVKVWSYLSEVSSQWVNERRKHFTRPTPLRLPPAPAKQMSLSPLASSVSGMGGETSAFVKPVVLAADIERISNGLTAFSFD